MSINLNILNKVGQRGTSNNNSSVAKNKRKINETKRSKTKSLNTAISSTATSLNKGLNLASGGSSGISLTKVAGATSMAVAAGVAIASKSHDLYVGIQRAKSGNNLYYSNIATKKKTIMMLGLNYLSGALNNALTTRHEIARENMGLEYHREIYNLNNFNEKNKIR